MKPINLAEKLSTFTEHGSRELLASSMGMASDREGQGGVVWHKHDSTDDFFLVLKGRVTIQMRGQRDVTLGPGEMFVVPKGVEHCPLAEVESHMLLIEPSGTPNTGDPESAAPRRLV